jgi:RNA polymerase sigma-B factor
VLRPSRTVWIDDLTAPAVSATFAPPRRAEGPRRSPRVREDLRLLAQYRRAPDRATRDAIVERFLPLARQLARRYHGGGEPLDDLMQVAAIGLMNAIDRFDPAHGSSFSTFAVPTIVGELKRHFRDRSWSIRLPRDLQEFVMRMERVTDQIVQDGRRPPTAQELAAELGVTLERVLEARVAAAAHRPVSLDQPPGPEGEGTGLLETVGADDPGYRRADTAVTVDHLLQVLTARDREVLRLRFEQDLTQSEIGSRLGISQMHVSRIIRQAIARLRDAAEADGVRHAT